MFLKEKKQNKKQTYTNKINVKSHSAFFNPQNNFTFEKVKQAGKSEKYYQHKIKEHTIENCLLEFKISLENKIYS